MSYGFAEVEEKLQTFRGNDELYVLIEIKKLLMQIELNTRKA